MRRTNKAARKGHADRKAAQRAGRKFGGGKRQKKPKR